MSFLCLSPGLLPVSYFDQIQPGATEENPSEVIHANLSSKTHNSVEKIWRGKQDM